MTEYRITEDVDGCYRVQARDGGLGRLLGWRQVWPPRGCAYYSPAHFTLTGAREALASFEERERRRQEHGGQDEWPVDDGD